jgi:hypothetical protein
MAQQRKQAGTVRKPSCPRAQATVTDADALRQALEWFACSNSFVDLRLHGNVGWCPVQLVVLAVLWVWSEQSTLTGAFAHALSLAGTMFGQTAVTTYQGLTGALKSYGKQLLPQLWSLFHGRMEECAGQHWRIGLWLALAVDGSRVSTPRTVSNEQAFSAKNYGHGGKAKSRKKWKNKKRRSKKLSEPVKPQIWLTLIWHMGLKMPWCWKTGPSTACERHHLQDMLKTYKFPENTLFCADAGFVGYEFWKDIHDRGHHFLIRVGGNVRLLRKLGHAQVRNDLVYVWPDAAQRKKQPPLLLRFIEFQGTRGKVYLVTNVLSQRELSLTQAKKLYRLRWGVELQFRAFKQTFGRRKLRSRTADNAQVELDWSLVGLWLIQLFAVKEQVKIHVPPEQSSVALALHVFQDAMRNWCAQTDACHALAERLRQATKDTYHRTAMKQARYHPNYKDKPGASKPIIVTASRAQIQAYQALDVAA